GECYDRVPQQQGMSVYELLPGGDDPRAPATPMTVPGDFTIGAPITGLRDMNQILGTRTLILLDSRRVTMAPLLQPCTGSAVGLLTETFGGIEWRITGCRESASDGEAFAQLRIEEARPSSSTPRYFL